MGFKEKLTSMCIHGDRAATIRLDREIRSIAWHVATVLKSGKWDSLSLKTDRHLGEASDSARDAAEVGDAAAYVYEKVLNAGNGQVVDLRMKRDLGAVQTQIYDLFANGDAPSRGFVYVAWGAKPERFMYVGKAKDTNRLKLAAHGNLAHAAAHVASLSLLFPTQSRDEILCGVEASVIRLIEERTGRMPELNKKHEHVPIGPPSERLGLLADFFSSVSDDLIPLDRKSAV